MSLPAPPYQVKSVDSPVEQDAHGNSGAFITLQDGTECLLRMKGVFPHVGDLIEDRVLEQATSKAGNTYLKLVKPSRNGGSGGQQGRRGEAPDEAYWAGQNAAKGRAHAQEIACRAYALGFRPEKGNDTLEDLVAFIDFFEKDVHAARDRAVEEAGRPTTPGAPGTPPGGHDGDGGSPPEPPSGPSHYGPTDKQMPVLLKMARERGLDGPAMKRYLKAYCGVEAFSDLPKQGCLDKWGEALKRPDPVSDIPVDDTNWPPPADTAEADEEVPF